MAVSENDDVERMADSQGHSVEKPTHGYYRIWRKNIIQVIGSVSLFLADARAMLTEYEIFPKRFTIDYGE